MRSLRAESYVMHTHSTSNTRTGLLLQRLIGGWQLLVVDGTTVRLCKAYGQRQLQPSINHRVVYSNTTLTNTTSTRM
jgi:hypothetical protein